MTKKDKNKDIVDVTQKATPEGSNLVAFDELDRWFDNFLSQRWPYPSNWKFPEWPDKEFTTNLPKVDIIDHDHEIEIQAALPGVRKEDLDVSISENSITIRASTRTEQKQENKHFYRQEISRGEFQRTLSLPANVDNEQAKATFKDGILDITLPKSEKSKRKSIEIK